MLPPASFEHLLWKADQISSLLLFRGTLRGRTACCARVHRRSVLLRKDRAGRRHDDESSSWKVLQIKTKTITASRSWKCCPRCLAATLLPATTADMSIAINSSTSNDSLAESGLIAKSPNLLCLELLRRFLLLAVQNFNHTFGQAAGF